MSCTLTLDEGLMAGEDSLAAVRTLKHWEAEGRIQLFGTDPPKDAVSVPFNARRARTERRPGPYRMTTRPGAGSSPFQRISAVLFPNRDCQRLNMGEINDVAHLVLHLTRGHNFFVTTNVRAFIAEGKRELLRAAFQIEVLTPDEAVNALDARASGA